MTYVSSKETGNKKSDFEIGLLGRYKRDRDAKELEIIHIEDAQNNA